MKFTIGRASDNIYRIENISVSNHHAELQIVDDFSFILKDLGSSGGTYVNDAKINVLAPTSQFGLNVFEGIPCYWNEDESQLYAFRLDEHYKRLEKSAKLLQLDCKYSKEDFKKSLIEIVKKAFSTRIIFLSSNFSIFSLRLFENNSKKTLNCSFETSKYIFFISSIPIKKLVFLNRLSFDFLGIKISPYLKVCKLSRYNNVAIAILLIVSLDMLIKIKNESSIVSIIVKKVIKFIIKELGWGKLINETSSSNSRYLSWISLSTSSSTLESKLNSFNELSFSKCKTVL